MRALLALLLVLVLPGLVLGPGLDLRICAHKLVRAECCGVERASACCPGEAPTPAEPVAERPASPMVCCISIETSHDCGSRAPERDSGSLERAHLAALVPLAAVLAPSEPARAGRAPVDRPPPPPGRCTPLPLRI